MKIAFGVCSIGLGHATRSLPLIEKLIEQGNELTVFSYSRALALLKKSVTARFVEMEDYPLQYLDNPKAFFAMTMAKSPTLIKSLLKEHRQFLKYHQKFGFDMVISDNRYGVFVKNTPSFLITHQLRILNPSRVRTLEYASQIYSAYVAKYFKKILIPDFEYHGLSGIMSHNLNIIDTSKIVYIGPLSGLRKKKREKDLDLLISISGPEPQRSVFERIIQRQIKDLDIEYLVTLGTPETSLNHSGRIISYLSFEEREELFNRAKFIISRSGYSTIMDLYIISGRAMFVPTPYQPEQEYLSQSLKERGLFYSVSQKYLNIKEDIKKGLAYPGFENVEYDQAVSIKNFLKAIGVY